MLGKCVYLQNHFSPLNFPYFAVKRMVEDDFFKSLIDFLVKTSHISNREQELDWSDFRSHLSSPENVCNNKGWRTSQEHLSHCLFLLNVVEGEHVLHHSGKHTWPLSLRVKAPEKTPSVLLNLITVFSFILEIGTESCSLLHGDHHGQFQADSTSDGLWKMLEQFIRRFKVHRLMYIKQAP